MADEKWRTRLAEAIEASGKSARAVSLAAGLNPGYVHSILVEGKDPTIDNLVAVGRAINKSLTYIVYGYNVTPDVEELLQLLENHPERRDGVIQILRS